MIDGILGFLEKLECLHDRWWFFVGIENNIMVTNSFFPTTRDRMNSLVIEIENWKNDHKEDNDIKHVSRYFVVYGERYIDALNYYEKNLDKINLTPLNHATTEETTQFRKNVNTLNDTLFKTRIEVYKLFKEEIRTLNEYAKILKEEEEKTTKKLTNVREERARFAKIMTETEKKWAESIRLLRQRDKTITEQLAEIEKLKKELESLKSEKDKDKDKNQIAELTKLKNKAEQQLQSELTKIQNLSTENLSLQEKAKKAEEAAAAIIISSSLLNNQKQELETTILNLNREKETAKNQIANYEKEIQQILKKQTNLEIDNEKLVKNNQELQNQLNQRKDKISKLEGDANLITNQLNDLEEELEITPMEEEKPENKTLSKKISFFENWWKKTKQEKEEITQNLQKEREEMKNLRQSLSELEEQSKNTDNDNLQQFRRLDQENKGLKKKLSEKEINLGGEKRKVENLEQEIVEQKSQAKKLGLNLNFYQKQIANQQKENKILWYCLIGAMVVILLGIGYVAYQKFKNYLSPA